MGLLNTLYVFLFFLAFGYLIAGNNVMLRLSTRIVLIVLFGSALLFATSIGTWWHETVGVATLIANLGWRDAVLKDQMLYKGVNLANGKCVYKPVADDLGIGYEPLRP